jgi:hypothetical protein
MAVRASLGFFLILLLASCGDSGVELPRVFGNEVPPDVLNEPRAVPSAPLPSNPENWPLLGDVPSRPKDFTPQPVIDAAKTQMEGDRDADTLLQQNYQAAPAVVPASP